MALESDGPAARARTKYAGYVRLPLKGRWRIVAIHAHEGCKPDVSAPRFLIVR